MMETMAALFANGRVVDVILVLVGFEALAVLSYRAATGRGPAPLPFVANLLAGAFLMVALRNALEGASWIWIASSLVAALAAHFADLMARWGEKAPLEEKRLMGRRSER
jgi:hypothetical protein